jgi:hypothetical protein
MRHVQHATLVVSSISADGSRRFSLFSNLNPIPRNAACFSIVQDSITIVISITIIIISSSNGGSCRVPVETIPPATRSRHTRWYTVCL